jgi:methyltransferase (TIGR00027 family)
MLTVEDTAFSIAVVRADEAHRPVAERLFEDPYAAMFAEAGAHAAEGTKRFLDLPFFRDGVRLRTRFIDDFVRDGLAAGLTQVVLLGAGFDSRGLRMGEIEKRQAAVFEIDTQSQVERKRDVLSTHTVELPPWIAHVPFNFETLEFEGTLTSALEASGFRRNVGALFVWEGVIGYIDSAAIDRTVRFMVNSGGPRSRVVLTYGEGSFVPTTAAERTKQAGFSSFDELGFDEVWRRYLPGDPHPHACISKIGTAVV